MNIRHLTVLLAAAAGLLTFSPRAAAHCQVPCGIFDNDNVIKSMHQDWETIVKACKQIDELSKDTGKNIHQITRWIKTKEEHAQAMQEKTLNYFLAQRLKPDMADQDAYTAQLKLCHQIIITAMKCKQSTDQANLDKLHDLMHRLEVAFGSK